MPSAFIAVRHLLVISLALGLAACDSREPTAPQATESTVSEAPASNDGMAVPALDARWQAHLAAMPAGVISARGAIMVRFNHPVVAESAVGKPLSGAARLASQQPVTVIAESRDRLAIRPDAPLKGGQSLTLMLYAQGLDGIDDDLPPASLPLHVMRQQMSLTVESLLPAAQGDEMVLSGTLHTRDMADPAAVENVLSAQQSNATPQIQWSHGPSGLQHEFTVTGIVRDAQPGRLTLSWKGEPLALANHGERHYDIPAVATFAVTNVRAVNYPEPHVEVNFSEPLQGSQNLIGLVSLDDDLKPRTEVDGSRLRIYPGDDAEENVKLVIEAGVRSAKRARLGDTFQQTLTLIMSRPGVRFVGKGTILPNNKTLSVPFEASAASSVKVQAFRVFENSIGHYLQRSDLDEAYMDTRSGRYLWQKTLPLPDTGEGWQRYQLDLTELMDQHPNGLLHLTLTIDGDDIRYACPEGALSRKTTLPDNDEGPGQHRDDDPVSDYYRDSGYLSWYEQEDPCSDSYYRYNELATSSRAFLASNLGLIAKQGQDNTLHVVATGLDDNAPAEDVVVNVYNYQQQQIGKGVTDGEGMVSVSLEGTPFYLKAVKGRDSGFLKVARNRALPTNQFNTGGEQVRDGLKGFFYGERDVWRPGDTIHLTFVLEDRHNHIPDNHPLTLDWFDPQGNKVDSYTLDTPVNGFYAFTLTTRDDAPTGNWQAVARLGQRYFDTPVRVEAIKPNRLKIDLTLADKVKANQSSAVELFTQWLNGATAANLKADVKVRVRRNTTRFAGLDAYQFDDASRVLGSEPFTAFDASVDAEGKAAFPLTIPVEQPPGMLRATLTTRVFENSGDYSTQVRTIPVFPYSHWAGLRIPQGTGWGNSLGKDKPHPIDLVSVDSDGKAVAGRSLNLTVYEIDWRWWWDRSGNDLTHFLSDPHTRVVSEAQLTTDADGRAQWMLNGEDYDWGRHLIRVCDNSSAHCASQTVYLGWSWDRASDNQDAATRLSLTADKERYQVGETAHIELPAVAEGRLLISLEDGSGVLEHYWLAATGQPQTLDIPVTAAMAPNVYVHVALLQPHQRDNDRPIRLYGIVPLLVDDPATRLLPQISAPEQVRPEQPFTVSVSENQGRSMTYTLALVDEGLLGLTNFQTPDPHQAFYRREALGVLTWDLFDLVVGAYGAELDQLLALGGSDGSDEGRDKQRRRFPPIVKFLGPFTLQPGATDRHDITLPPYMGQVRAMVVAGHSGAYGKAEHDITVSQPLTLLSTLPRVLGPGETVDLPVTVFVTDDSVKSVDLRVQADESLFTLDKQSTELTFTGPSDQIAMLRLTAKQQVGMGDITLTASGGQHRASETVHLPVRAANPATTRDSFKVLEKGESWALHNVPHGMAGTNSASLAVSSMPAMGLERRLDYLLRYPHGCIEQTTSAALPQLYLPMLLNLSAQQTGDIESNIRAAIARLQGFQMSGGGFSYWPGLANADDWGTSYAGHFLLEARRLGYAVPAAVMDNWISYQIRQSQNLGQRPWQWNAEAYRQFTLALAGKPQVGVMNRLRERLQQAQADYRHSASYHSGRWLLAAAYQQMGLAEVAAELTGLNSEGLQQDGAAYTYGSSLRDQAVRLTVSQAQGDSQQAWALARDIADQLASERWLSTQSTAWSLMAMARYAGSHSADNGYRFAVKEGVQGWQEIAATSPLTRQGLAAVEQPLTVRNDSERKLFVTVSNSGTPAPGNEQALSKGLALAVQFYANGKPVSPARMIQGQDFTATVTVTNHTRQTLENVALTQILPSGWQITSSRLDGSAGDEENSETVTYQDLRDDRVMHYFDLAPGKANALTLTVALNASFAGRFYLPAWTVEAMYDGRYQARSQGQWVDVTR